MKVGIVEICEPNHYTAAEALMQSYSTNPQYEVYMLVSAAVYAAFSSRVHKENVYFIVKEEQTPTADFLGSIQQYALDCIHINTISNDYADFAKFNWREAKVIFTVHNVEEWFGNSFQQQIHLLLFKLGRQLLERNFWLMYQTAVLFFKDLPKHRARKKFIHRLIKSNYRILVYSQAQQDFLANFIPREHIIRFPFILHQHLPDISTQNSKLRICIPGVITNQRRDYTQLLQLLSHRVELWREHITIELLGYVPAHEKYLENEIKQLVAQGLDIVYYSAFVGDDINNTALSHADLILGNMRTILNPYQKYGKTKESGTVFNMIKSGKPAILPSDYTVDDDLREACLFFDSYEHLGEIINRCLIDTNFVADLKQKAARIAQQYTPEKLLPQLLK